MDRDVRFSCVGEPDGLGYDLDPDPDEFDVSVSVA
jgi:hypothetical protein|tara:strand:+ start:312 stop:416 length:105 start_codon:yes stop_codon:yes gene_type:complete